MLFKIVSIFMVAYFLLSIGVQYNDPDSLIWMGLYAAILMATLLTLFKATNGLRWQLVLLILLYGTGVVYLSGSFRDTSLDAFRAVGMSSLTDEKVRELWGLVICLLWAIALLIHSGMRPKQLTTGT